MIDQFCASRDEIDEPGYRFRGLFLTGEKCKRNQRDKARASQKAHLRFVWRVPILSVAFHSDVRWKNGELVGKGDCNWTLPSLVVNPKRRSAWEVGVISMVSMASRKSYH